MKIALSCPKLMSAVSAAPLSSLTGGQISSVVSSCSAFLMTPSSGLDFFQQSLTALALPGKQTKTIGKVLLTMLPALVASTAGMDEGGVKGEVEKVGAEIGEWGRQDLINSLCSAVKQLKEVSVGERASERSEPWVKMANTCFCVFLAPTSLSNSSKREADNSSPTTPPESLPQAPSSTPPPTSSTP